MFNNRMLAVAAVLAMAVPALGAAAPIVVPPVAEQLVEGHTVFTVIEVARETNVTQERFAAAVAVLVREYEADRAVARFPGVLWFNDQYLVNPSSRTVRDEAFRYPCGGAVLAVNAGDPDPRIVMLRAEIDGGVFTIGSGGEQYPTDYAWLGVKADTVTPAADVYSDTVKGSITEPINNNALGLGIDYDESYLITDPNDHVWVVDKYNFYTRTSPAGLTTTSYAFPVWVVNMLGSPVFLPDEGDNCNPYYDLITIPTPAGNVTLMNGVYDATKTAACATGLPIAADFPARDDPCAGYLEPSRNGFCYGGQQEAAIPATTYPAGCDEARKPKRLYNALLYFKLEDLTQAGGIRDHTNPVTSGDTNGCQTGTEWVCPGYDGVNPNSGDDNAEGNSHPFHPVAPGHTEKEPCPPYFAGPNPTNHGGSTTPGVPDCDYLHATRNIDIYFSGAGRPFTPLLRNFDVLDLEGSTAPFQDFHSAYPGVGP